MSDAEGGSGWVAWSGDSWADLEPETRERVRRKIIERHRERGPLAAIVYVRVYAEGAESHVSFTDACTLSPDADPKEIAAVVDRARLALAEWR